MSKIVGILSSGFGGKRIASSYQQDLDHVFQGINHDENQDQRDAEAFQELQKYADFQRVLSNRVENDIFRERNYTSTESRILGQGPDFSNYFSHKPYVHPIQEFRPRGTLSYPVIIPQRRSEDESRGWVRAYAPALMDCGIDQYTFLNFLDGFNELSKSLTYLDAVNIARLGVGFAPGITPIIISMAISLAVHLAKTVQTEKRSTIFLNRANKELFAPHGLFAMVVTYKPTTSSRTHIVDPSNPSQPSPTYQSSSSINSPQLPTSSTLVFPVLDLSGSTSQQNSFKQPSYFNTDYVDQKAQSTYPFEHPHSTLATPTSTIRSRRDDSNNPANSGGNSGSPPFRDETRKERKEKRRNKNASSLSGEGRTKSRGLAGRVRSMMSGPGKEEKAFVSRLRARDMNKDVFYLLIVNAPEASASAPMPNTATPTSQNTYPYHQDQESKYINSPPLVLEPDPFQGPWTPDFRVGWIPNDRYAQPMGYQSQHESRRRSPPPAYSRPQTTVG